MKTEKKLRELTNYFAVLDLFGGTPPVNDYYEKALAKAKKRGATFTEELWNEACQCYEQP